MPTTEDELPRKPQPQKTKPRRYRARRKPDVEPADITFIRIMRHTRSKSPRLAWRDLIQYLLANPGETRKQLHARFR